MNNKEFKVISGKEAADKIFSLMEQDKIPTHSAYDEVNDVLASISENDFYQMPLICHNIIIAYSNKLNSICDQYERIS